MEYKIKIDGQIEKCGQCPLDWHLGLCEVANRFFDPETTLEEDIDAMDRPVDCPLKEV